jgi:hypothetical protein
MAGAASVQYLQRRLQRSVHGGGVSGERKGRASRTRPGSSGALMEIEAGVKFTMRRQRRQGLGLGLGLGLGPGPGKDLRPGHRAHGANPRRRCSTRVAPAHATTVDFPSSSSPPAFDPSSVHSAIVPPPAALPVRRRLKRSVAKQPLRRPTPPPLARSHPRLSLGPRVICPCPRPRPLRTRSQSS